jgi:hypothetical protein
MPDKKLTEEQLKAIQTMGASLSTLGIAPATTLPFQDLLQSDAISKIKQQEAMRMFPQADPNLFDYTRGGTLPYKKPMLANEVIPLTEQTASSRVFDKEIKRNSPLSAREIYRSKSSLPEYLSGRPGTPSPELGSFANAISNKSIFPEGDIQAITVTPSPNPSRFAQDYAEILADKLGKTLNEFESGKEWNSEAARQARKIDVLSSKIPGTAGYVWGNTDYPQYTYAEGNWGLGQKLAGENPSIYLSRINADPSREAKYLYTGDVLPAGQIEEKGYLTVDPRAKFKQYEELGPGTGPSWGVAPNKDISFRKDLIGARGELTTGDLQALLAERGLPFEYQIQASRGPRKKPGDVLRANLETLASSENISPSQAAEKYARLIPNVGEPSTPPTTAVSARGGEFPVQGQMSSPFGRFAAKTDLRQIGILPPGDKATYSPFTVNEFNASFQHTHPRYGASQLEELTPSRMVPALPGSLFEEDFIEGTYKLNMNRDILRPKAANKLLNKTTETLIEQAKPVRGLGLGGLATGGILTAMDPGVIDALARGDYQQAGTTAALNTAIGSVTGGATAKGLQALQAAGYARPAAAIGSALPVVGGALAGLGLVETGKALNRVYRGQTGKDWVTRNQPPQRPQLSWEELMRRETTPSIQPRMGKAVLNGRLVDVPYGSVAGTKTVGRPWWDKAGSAFEGLLNRFNAGSIIGR